MATGTRIAKLMEEQVGTLLATLQEQGQRQEQLARDQANHFSRQLEQLAQEQRERHAAFSEQFTEQLAQEQRQRHAEFSQQFSEQLERLVRDQRQSWEQWSGSQQRIEKRIQTLEGLYTSKEPGPQQVKREEPEREPSQAR